ncbi:MAG TPA: ATP-binding protein [Candidatus Polarisedimenticolia bacterium]|nr:ATP-binding protein [Candidatus Polarisedimenticolia bacterium]
MVRVSLALRFIVFTSLLILATSLSLSVFFFVQETRSEDEEIRLKGISLARNLAHNAELGVLTRNGALLRELAKGLLQEGDVISVAVTDAEGNPLLDEKRATAAGRNLQALPEVQSVQVGAGEARIVPFSLSGGDGTEAYEVSYPVFTHRGDRRNEEIGFLLEEEEDAARKLETIGHARLVLSLETLHSETQRLEWGFGFLTFLVIAVAILLTVMLVRKMVAPLRDLAGATKRVAEGNLDEAVPETTRDEIGQLARFFNQMILELRRSRRELEMYSADLENQVRLRTHELEEAQSHLVQAEKMSAVGLLVSGVAHELNNPLAGVIGYSQLLMKSDTDEKVRRGLEKINREAERCKKIVQNLQTFARKHKPQKDYIGINGILEGTLELRSYQLKVDNIKVISELDPDLPKTMADFHQLQQVFLNIVINAHHAMASTGAEGSLTLRSQHRDGMILVEIEDTGPGISPENIGRIFDPFFTTKEVGQGTGLGLSICYGIIQEHKGRISARNSSSGGAVFTVELPVIEIDATGDALKKPTEDPLPEDLPGRNILVVDDEPAIIDILYQVLKGDGHRVDTALNGTVALRKIQKEQYDLIISDLKMPGMNGQELYERVRELDHDLSRRIIFSTGDVLSSDTHGFLEKSGNSYLQKPFELDAIRRIVHAVLVATAHTTSRRG